MRAEEIKGLMEAYSKVHETPETPEVLSEGVVDLSDEDLEGIELIEMTMEEIDQLNEQGQPGAAIAQQAKRQRVAAQGQVKTALGQGKGIALQSASGLGQGTKPNQKAFGTQMGGRQGVVVKGGASGPDYGPRGGSSFTRAADTVNVGGQTLYKAKKGNDIVYLQGKGKPQLFKPKGNKPAKPETPTPAPTKPGNTGTPTPAPKPGPSAPKPTKPAEPAGQTGDKAKDMATWRAANPKLAAAADEKARIRGTSQTDNPLIDKEMRARMPMTPSVQSPTLQKDLGNLAKNYTSLTQNPNASKAATPKPAAAAKPVSAPPIPLKKELPGKEINTSVTKPTPKPADKSKEDLFAHVDIFDIVKGHLLDEGYADSEEGAMVIMINMSEEWKKSILEAHGVELDEAQEAREKPEEHEEKEEKENEKKYGHVRGEKTPMPPRGDKRREEFEKWYAKQGR